MKTKIYFLLAVIVFGILTAAFPVKANAAQTILIQSTNKNVSDSALSHSAVIISNRLKEFSSDEFELKIIFEMKQIQVTFYKNTDVKVAEKLLTQKGEIGFYNVLARKNLSEDIKDDIYLNSKLERHENNERDARIGCCSVAEANSLTGYLNSLGKKKLAKFSWSFSSDNAVVCLFALKLEDNKKALLSGDDIQSMKSGVDKTHKMNYIEFSFKKPAAEKWALITKQNIGNQIAIVLDNEVLCAPVVRSAIENGRSMITGNFTETEMKLIAALSNNGELPLNFNVLK